MKKYPQPRFHETGHPDTILTLLLVTANRYELFHKILLPNSFWSEIIAISILQ